MSAACDIEYAFDMQQSSQDQLTQLLTKLNFYKFMKAGHPVQ